MLRSETQYGGISSPVSRRCAAVASLGLLALVLGVSTGCSDRGAESKPAQAGGFPVIPVMVGKTVEKTVPVQIQVIGNGEAYSTVQLKSQVDGQVDRVYFTEGQDVKKGDLLFTLDKRPFEASLAQAQANLARDQAQLKNAQGQWQRNAQLFKDGIISKDQYDQFQTNAAAYEATVHADEAAVETAKIQLGYCSIFAPIDGRTGALEIHAGNLVKNNDAALVVINQISPLYVDFSVPEQYLPEIKHYVAAGKLHVQAVPRNDPGPAEDGYVSFVNNTVDTSTGTIVLKGTFTNSTRRLWPGQFLNVVLTLTSHPHTVVAPAQAVQRGQNGQYVFVVKDDQTVELRPVTVGNTVGGETVVSKGLQPGETVVTDGQLLLSPGARVQIKSSL